MALAKFNKLASDCRSAVYKFELQCEERIINSDDQNRFYKFAKSRMHSNSSIGLIRKPDNTFTSDANDIAKLFSDHYAAVSLSDNGVIPDFVPAVKATIDSTELVFGPSKIKKILGNLKEKSSGGPDDLPPIFLRNAKIFLVLFSLPFFKSVTIGHFCHQFGFLPLLHRVIKKVIKQTSKIIDRYLLLALLVR
jgi:hypothetical protein